MFEVEFYENVSGKEPIKDLLVDLLTKGKSNKSDRIRGEKILTYIRVLQEYGTWVGEPYIKNIDGPLWELRPLTDRIIFFSHQKGTFILLHHFVKKTKKTPRREVDQARRNLRDYLERTKMNGYKL